jgi:hypothetical protein
MQQAVGQTTAVPLSRVLFPESFCDSLFSQKVLRETKLLENDGRASTTLFSSTLPTL